MPGTNQGIDPFVNSFRSVAAIVPALRQRNFVSRKSNGEAEDRSS
jgi:hypothetical protein